MQIGATSGLPKAFPDVVYLVSKCVLCPLSFGVPVFLDFVGFFLIICQCLSAPSLSYYGISAPWESIGETLVV